MQSTCQQRHNNLHMLAAWLSCVCRVHRHVGLRLCVWGAAAASRVDRQGHHTTAAGAGDAFAVSLHVLAGRPCSGADYSMCIPELFVLAPASMPSVLRDCRLRLCLLSTASPKRQPAASALTAPATASPAASWQRCLPSSGRPAGAASRAWQTLRGGAICARSPAGACVCAYVRACAQQHVAEVCCWCVVSPPHRRSAHVIGF